MKKLVLIALALVALAAITSVPALAKGGHVPKSEGTLTVTPSATTVGVPVTISGSGFQADTQYFIRVFDAAGEQVFNLGSATDSSGNLDPVQFTAQAAGEYSVQAFQLRPSGVLATRASASATLTVA